MGTKKRKILDCFFYYDEIEMLEFRLSRFYDDVDLFIIIECESDFLFNKKERFLDLNDDRFEKFKDKIFHMFIPEIKIETLENFFTQKKFNSFLQKVRREGIKKIDSLKYIISYFSDFIIRKNFNVEDVVIFSDVDEIPDFSLLNDIIDNLKYGPVVLRQKNFLWSEKFYLQGNYYGTIVISVANILHNDEFIYSLYTKKGSDLFSKNSITCGWHFSHFYNIERTQKKFSILYPDLNLKREDIIESISTLKNPIPNSFGFCEKFIENEIFDFGDLSSLPTQFLGRNKPKKIMVNLKSFELNDNLLPKKVLYGDSDLSSFQYKFFLNEITKKLVDYNPLNIDIFSIIFDSSVNEEDIDWNKEYVDSDKRFAVFKWKTLKNNILTDLIGL